LFTSVFAQTDPQQYISPVNNTGNSTNAPVGKIDIVRISIVEGAPTLGEKAFSPDITNTNIGSNITWTNGDSQFHTITSGTEPDDPNVGERFDSEVLSPNEIFSYVTNATGEIPYFCQLHPTMKGKLIIS
jgi:plastocyanin